MAHPDRVFDNARMRAAGDSPNLYGLDRAGLAAALLSFSIPGYRVRQVFSALYRRDALDPRTWSDLPVSLRESLADSFVIERPRIASRVRADDGTTKFALDLPGGGRVESVAIPADDRMTFCISSQVGCAFGCAFCMTAKLGFTRNLTAGEIAGQVAALIAETGVEHGEYNIVYMGMGEPLHNFDGVKGSLHLLFDELGFALGPKRVTVSTVGLPKQIRALASEPVPPRLAVSLVTADQALRESLMPVARKFKLDELCDAIRAFGEGKRERPTLEVVMLGGVNDAPSLAAPLAEYARRARAKVNLIEFNPTPELPYVPASEERIAHFLRVLTRAGVVGTVRRSRGKDAFAACGQLAFLER
ncbi:MAG: 23S rRNA (adenine(2503)-C(2))-methyltransferase RlmN [Acidobacteria bacterium]|nr:23S rRNA (adenine(2503)-C(2))-methyltransferase RlmN [Acidobacteriota bacterium]